jgi:hypothetical protein
VYNESAPMNLTINLDVQQFSAIQKILQSQVNATAALAADVESIDTPVQTQAAAMVSLAASLAAIVPFLGRIATAVEKIEAELVTPPSATEIAFSFTRNKGELNMPEILPDNDQDTFFIIGTDPAGVQGSPLAPGQTVAVVSADPATVIVTLDASPKTATNGLASVASGIIASAQPPAQPNVAITLTATVSNADASVAETITDTVTVTPGAASKIGVLFGPNTPVTSAPVA